MHGWIVKGVGSFYTVLTESGDTVTLRAKGVLRLGNQIPAIGDEVEWEGEVIKRILPRKTYIDRPPIANATAALIIVAVRRPDISLTLTDKMIIAAKKAGLETILCCNKIDLAHEGDIDSLKRIYADCGSRLLFISVKSGEGLEEVTQVLSGARTIFSGVSGAGKSTLMAAVAPLSNALAGTLSEKTQRGRQTTRHAELYFTSDNSIVFDTPGFSSLTLTDIASTDLWQYYPEFYDYSDCRFDDCLHLAEPGCNVKDAVAGNDIALERYENYKSIYSEIKEQEK